jgi:hypothetical protein
MSGAEKAWTGFCPDEGAIDLSPGFKSISANLIKVSTERMYFVPEGQHDRSQARSAWRHEENSPVPAGRLNGSRLRLDANIPFNRNTERF